jgi:hypothetical protein
MRHARAKLRRMFQEVTILSHRDSSVTATPQPLDEAKPLFPVMPLGGGLDCSSCPRLFRLLSVPSFEVWVKALTPGIPRAKRWW